MITRSEETITRFTMRKTVLAICLIFFLGQGYINAQSLGRIGAADITTTPVAGTVLMGGGTDVNGAFKWMITKSGGGDFVVIRASGTNAYNSYIYNLGGANSVETFLVDSKTKANDSTIVQAVRKAEAIFFAGGDQGQYVTFYKGSALGKVIDYLANVKHAPIGGTSAGMAIMSNVYYSAILTSVDSPAALANPYCTYDDVRYDDFLNNPFLENTITDTHFLTRNRQGRTMCFLARMIKDKDRSDVKAIACDEGTAVCIDENGIAMVVGTSKAHFIRQWCSGPEICEPGKPLNWTTGAQVYVIRGTGRSAEPSATLSVDLKNWTTVAGGAYEYWTVNNGVITLGQASSTPVVCGPMVKISKTPGTVPANNKFNLTVAFSEDVTGFDISDISVTNCTAGNFIALNSRHYTVDITPLTSAGIIISIEANKAINSSGISNTASNSLYVNTPSIVISRTSGTGTVNAKFNVTFTFSEDVTGFDISDISVTNGTPGNFIAINAAVYTVDITPTASDTISVSVAADKATNIYGINNTASNKFQLSADISPPTLVISRTSGSGAVYSGFNVTFTFSEYVLGFNISDISVSNGTAGNFATVSTAKIYSADITPTLPGNVTINVAAASAQDFAGNLSLAASPLSVEYLLTGIEPIKQNCLNVFPNPASGGFKIQVESVKGQTIKIFDVNGNLVYSALIKDNITEIDTHSLSKGTYLLQVMDGRNTSTRKIIVP